MLVYLLYSFLGEKFLKKYLIFISRFGEQLEKFEVNGGGKCGQKSDSCAL